MLKASYLIAQLAVLFLFVGCPGGDDDDDIAQDCSGDHHISSESEFEAIAQCDSIEGDLYFDDQTWLTSIDMPALTSVDGWLFIRGNPALASLDLSNLTSVSGSLAIIDNAFLTSLDGLSSLATVDNLYISGNDCLGQTEVEAFVAGLTVGGLIEVFENGSNHPCN